MSACKYHPLNDIDWLKQVYLTEQKSTIEIAKLAGAIQSNSVRQALVRFGIPLRGFREAQIHKRENDNFVLDLPVIEGGLLGDASLMCYNKHSGMSMPKFKRRNKFKDHVEWVAKLVCGEWGVQHVKETPNHFRGQIFDCFTFHSLSHEKLMPVFQRWYPESNNYNKLVPRDFVLDKISLLHWFLDDGCCWQRRKGSSVKQFIIDFACESFSIADQNFLIEQMNDKWDLRATTRFYRINSQGEKVNRIHLPQSQVTKFFEIIKIWYHI